MDGRTGQLSGSSAAKESNDLSISTTLQESKEHLSALRSHIAFANQCLSLLQNQLTHAADTLSILQDQVVKAHETMERIAQAQGYNVNRVSHCHHSQCNTESSVADHVAVSAQNGQKLCSRGGVVHSACRVDFGQVRAPCQCTVCTESHEGELQQHQVDTPPHHQTHESAVASSRSQAQLSAEVCTLSYPSPASNTSSKTRPGGLPQGELSVKIEPNTSPVRETVALGSTQAQHYSSCTTDDSADPPKVESSSPMAHQLLQVIDVLQSADDEKDEVHPAGASKTSSTLHSAPQGGSPSVSHFDSFSDSMSRDSRLLRTMSPETSTFSRHRTSLRKNRKPGNAVMTGMTADFHSLDLMKVPQPVLASTLPPEFLVVPATNYDQDSPSPRALTAAKQVKESGSSSSDDGAVAITPFMTASAEVLTVGSSSTDSDGSRRSVTDVKKNKGEAAVVTCLTQSTAKVSNDPSYSGHSIVHINRCTRDTSNVPARPSSSEAIPNLSTRGLLKVVPSSLNSPRNGLQYVSTSDRQSSCTETTSTASPSIYEQFRTQSEAEPEVGQQTSVERQALEVSFLGSSMKTRAGSTGTKKPIILSRRSSREHSVPEGVVVLVPTIEDAKRLIASTGASSSGNTPVLIPQQMLSDIRSDKGRTNEGGSVTLPAKRHFDSVSSLTANDSPVKKLSTMTESL